MTPELKKVIAERVEILPRALREKLSDPVSLREQIVSLGKKYNLTVEQTTVIEDEVMLTLLAFAPYTELPENIARELGVEESAVLPVVGTILSEIFSPDILKQLDEIYAKQITGGQATPMQAQPVPTPTPSLKQTEQPQQVQPAWQHTQQNPPPAVKSPSIPVSAYAPPPAPAPQAPAPQVPPSPPQPLQAPLPPQTPPTPPAYVPAQDQPAPTPPAIPQYQKPLTSVPQYRNADLYKKTPL